MLLQFQYVKIPQSTTLNTYARKKLNKLINRYEIIQSLEVYFKLENNVAGKDKICEIECAIPGTRLHAKASKEYFEDAIKKAIAEITIQLEKKKIAIASY